MQAIVDFQNQRWPPAATLDFQKISRGHPFMTSTKNLTFYPTPIGPNHPPGVDVHKTAPKMTKKGINDINQ
jgi:hypothetical protein